MKRVQKHHSSSLKHSHAYDEFGSCVSINDAVNDKRKYFFDKGKQVEFILKTSVKGVLFYCSKPNQKFKDSDGVIHNFNDFENSINETFEHRNFKGDIQKNGFFFFKSNKIYINDAVEESRIIDTLFRSDISGKLLCGTPCIVEVIKSSDLSEKKAEYIQEKQILTFKIYIDDYGNQEFKYDSIVGNRALESIKESIQRGEGKLSELREYNKEQRRRRSQERSGSLEIEICRNNAELRHFKEECDKELSDIKAWLDARIKPVVELVKGKKDELDGGQRIKARIDKYRGFIFQEEEGIRSSKNEQQRINGRISEISKSISNLRKEINSIEFEIKRVETLEWSNIIDGLKILNTPVRLDECTVIRDVNKFIQGHKSTILGASSYAVKKPYMRRILNYKELTL